MAFQIENFQKKIFLIFFEKNRKKKFFENCFEKKLICVKVSQKMMLYHKMSMSRVYENVFQTSENYS